MENVSDPKPINRWTIPFVDFTESLKQAIKLDDREQLNHLLNDFWVCDNWILLKSDIQGEMQ